MPAEWNEFVHVGCTRAGTPDRPAAVIAILTGSGDRLSPALKMRVEGPEIGELEYMQVQNRVWDLVDQMLAHAFLRTPRSEPFDVDRPLWNDDDPIDLVPYLDIHRRVQE